MRGDGACGFGGFGDVTTFVSVCYDDLQFSRSASGTNLGSYPDNFE